LPNAKSPCAVVALIYFIDPKMGSEQSATKNLQQFLQYKSVNPANGKVLKKFMEITNKQLEATLKAAPTCFETWRCKTFAERAVMMAKAAAILRARVDDFAKPVTLEMAKLIAKSRAKWN
jgi:acyl-CoA reductase-like NAD-dependent aldehyde dehydrogenase